MKKPIEVTPRKSWSPGYLKSDEIDDFLNSKLSLEELEYLQNKRRREEVLKERKENERRET